MTATVKQFHIKLRFLRVLARRKYLDYFRLIFRDIQKDLRCWVSHVLWSTWRIKYIAQKDQCCNSAECNATNTKHWYLTGIVLGLHPISSNHRSHCYANINTFVLWSCSDIDTSPALGGTQSFLCWVMQHEIETDGQPEESLYRRQKLAHWWGVWQCKCRPQNAQREHGAGTEGLVVHLLIFAT